MKLLIKHALREFEISCEQKYLSFYGNNQDYSFALSQVILTYVCLLGGTHYRFQFCFMTKI